MRYAIKLFYDGGVFHGSQIQPNVRTVEGDFLNALKGLNIEFNNFQAAGRTDRGVSAICNVFAVSTDSKILKPRILNTQLSRDIRVLSVKNVDDNFNPRKKALERVYKYFLFDANYDLKGLKKAIGLFEGEHSFHNFAILDGKDPIRRISGCEISQKGEILIMTFVGESFLWQMIRRMVTALVMVGKGELEIVDLEACFDPKVENKFSPSKAENLVLWNVKYGFEFEDEIYSRENLVSMISLKIRGIKEAVVISEEILKELNE